MGMWDMPCLLFIYERDGVVLQTPFMVAIARLTFQKGGIMKCKHLLGCRGKMKLRVSQQDKDFLKNTKTILCQKVLAEIKA